MPDPDSGAEHAAAPLPADGWRRLSGHALVYIGATAFAALIPFLILPFLTRWLGPAEFGIVAGFLALVNLTALVVGLGTHGLIGVVYYRDGPEAMPPQVGASFALLALSGLPALLALYLLSGPIAARIGIGPDWLWTIWVAACAQFILSIALAVWQTLRRPWRFAATQASYSLLAAGGSLALIGLAGMGWAGRALGQAGGAGLVALVCVLALTRARKVDWRPSHWPMRPALAFGLGLLPHSIGAVAMASVDRFVLSGTVGTVATGHYFAAMQIASIMTALASAFNAAWNPWLFERLARGDAAAKHQVVRATFLVYGLIVLGAAIMVVLAPLVVRIVAGSSFDESAELLQLLAPAAAFSGMYYLVSGYAFFTERTGTLSIVTLSAAAIQATLTVILANIDGARGVALATLLSAFLYWAMTSIVAQRLVPMPWFRRHLAGAPS